MQIVANTTGMLAGLSFPVDKHGTEHCLVVVKGTFATDEVGNLSLAGEQHPLVYADEHYGDPETTCIRYESDFALDKPYGEVIVVGCAVAPAGQPVRELTTRLEVQGRKKDVLVVGDRTWAYGLTGMTATAPEPFVEMPLTYDRAYGGTDDSRGPGRADVEARNLRGLGHSPQRSAAQLQGLRLPNLERPGDRLNKPQGGVAPIGFGVLGRADQQRARYAGTYDQRWLDDVFPFLPSDFDDRYFMSTPEDQWVPRFAGGETIRCIHMSRDPVVVYCLPKLAVPIQFVFRDQVIPSQGRLDTVLVEPHRRRAMLTWRARVAVGKKLNRLWGVRIGSPPVPQRTAPIRYHHGKPRFGSLGDAVAWLRKRRLR